MPSRPRSAAVSLRARSWNRRGMATHPAITVTMRVFARQALVLQAAAPTAISVLLMAETEQADSTAVAQLIWRSTLMALITVPIWAVLLKTLGERLGT